MCPRCAPEQMRKFCPTVGAVFLLHPQHWLMHAGQWVIVRRKLGNGRIEVAEFGDDATPSGNGCGIARVKSSSAASSRAKTCMRSLSTKPRVVAIDLSAVTDLEYTALKMLTAAEEKQRKQGVSVWLVGLNPGGLQTVQRSSLSHLLGRDALQFNLELAVAKYQTSRLSAETIE